MDEFKDTAARIKEGIGKVVVGQDAALNELLTAFLVGGHVLLEGVPGVAKTLMVKCLARCVDSDFKRIQFTPDLMPSDIVGTNIFNLKENRFELNKGPVFTDLLLADEINRTPPKTQAALLEAMQERQATIDGVRYPLSDVFFVCATQNPLEYEGTYPLPEAQLDRFLMKIRVDYPEPAQEIEMLSRFHITPGVKYDPLNRIEKVVTREQLAEIKKFINRVKTEPRVLEYIVNIVGATRSVNSVGLGASPRASLSILHCAKAAAALDGQDYITPDHVKTVVPPVLRHRIMLTPEAEVEGRSVDHLIPQILSSVQVPR